MLYLSRLIHAPIVDADGVRLGTVGDVAVDLRDPLPRVTGLCMRTDRSRVALIPRDAVESLASQQVRLRVARRFLQIGRASRRERVHMDARARACKTDA